MKKGLKSRNVSILEQNKKGLKLNLKSHFLLKYQQKLAIVICKKLCYNIDREEKKCYNSVTKTLHL